MTVFQTAQSFIIIFFIKIQKSLKIAVGGGLWIFFVCSYKKFLDQTQFTKFFSKKQQLQIEFLPYFTATTFS